MATAMTNAYNGRVLRVNLTDGSIKTETISDTLCRQYVGGAGFVGHFLLKEQRAGVDPLGAGNKLVFAAGPLTGVLVPGTDRFCAGAKSPLSRGLAKSESGGYWGTELKRAGYDAVIIEGKSPKPVYLWIHDGEATIKDATHLWGMATRETQEAIRKDLSDQLVRLAMIGPGGENMVLYACIMVGLFDALGRGGLGAVMGSKNLKAVAVRGHHTFAVHDQEAVKSIRQWLLANMELARGFHEFGTGGAMAAFETMGNLPVRNFRDGLFPGVKKIDAHAIKATIRVGMDGCFACPVRCKKAVKFEAPYPVDPAYGGPEYETIAALGSNCGIDNLKAISKANELCNAYSLDTISLGNTIALAMECFEKGLLTSQDTGGIDLRFGNDEAILEIIELVVKRQGIGDLLAGGAARVARAIGRDAHRLAMHAKGLEPGMHDARVKPSMGLAYMVSPNGADHCMGAHDTSIDMRDLRAMGIPGPVAAGDIGPRKVAVFKILHGKNIMRDSLLICTFLPYSVEQYAAITRAVTGWDTNAMEQQRVAERVLTVMRLYNIREGLTYQDDVLPPRFFEPKTDGILSGSALRPSDMEKARSYFYRLMGWDPVTGVPSEQKLEELEISV